MNKRIIFMLLLLTVVAQIGVQQALAFQSYMNTFNATYNTTNTRIGVCIVCHDSIPVTAAPATNPYGVAVMNQDPGLGIGQRLANVETFDSDGDGFINIDEIHNLTFPGNSSDFPPTIPPPTPVGTFNISGFKINNDTGSGIQGWNITVTNTTIQKSVLTDADGSYKFTDLINGTYNVSEEMKPGFTPVGATFQSVTIVGQDITNVNFTNKPIPANFTFAADLIGSEEVPPVATLARGNATFNLSDDGTVLQFKVTVANITNVTLSHIHLAPAGVNGPIVANLFTGPTKTGRFDGVLAEGSITQADLIGPLEGLPLSALIENMTDGNTYVNAHTTQNPGGEIRGQIRVAPAPDARFSISGFKINGTTGSEIQGWNITLRNGTTDELIDSMPTNANGFYQFIVLVNGSYNVSEETRPGFTPVGETFQMETISGQDVTNVNFTNNVTVPTVNPPAITSWGNNKTNDASLDITVNVSETVLFNATANQSIDTWNWSVNNVNQNNNFDNFSKHFDTAGTFTVKVNATNANGTSNTVTWNVNVQAPPQVTFNISGFKINDTNGNGTWDIGEIGLENWNIILMNETTQMTAVTNATGFYQFTNLLNGTYNVTEELKAGWTNTSPISLAVTINGADATDINFKNMQVITPQTFNISGFKINDTNNNGTGIPGWEIMLLNTTTGTEIANTTTDDMGFYTFSDLTNGTYNVTEEMKSGWTNVSPTSQVIEISGSDVKNVNFTNELVPPPPPPPAAFNISGFKINGATDNGIGGWNITLTNETMQTTAVTDATGFYQFTNLLNGTYTVTEELKPDWMNVSPVSQAVTINGTDMMNVNFTNQLVTPPPAVSNISGFKINDTNGNGVWDSDEVGIENWNIKLLNATTGTEIANTMTNADGFYIFMDLPNGTYNVTEEMKEGWVNTSATSLIITLNGTEVTRVNFMNQLVPPPPPPPAAFNISGFKINDTNGNGRRDPGEVGLENWNIILTNETTQMTATTDANGFYQFMNLLQGTYTVREELKPGWTNTSPISRTVTIADMGITNVNFTNQLVPPPPPPVRNSISGFKINDLNGNERQDKGEEGLSGWTIRLIGIGPETSGITRKATTADRGFYIFKDLPAGKYLILESLKRGYVPTGAVVKIVDLEEGENSRNNNFTNRPISSLIRLPGRVRDT